MPLAEKSIYFSGPAERRGLCFSGCLLVYALFAEPIGMTLAPLFKAIK